MLLRCFGVVIELLEVWSKRPCQGRGREFESRFPLHFLHIYQYLNHFPSIWVRIFQGLGYLWTTLEHTVEEKWADVVIC